MYDFPAIPVSADVIERIVWRCAKDQWFMIEIERDGALQPAGFYTLRGLDEGYADPMYGVFIAEEFCGRGLGRSPSRMPNRCAGSMAGRAFSSR